MATRWSFIENYGRQLSFDDGPPIPPSAFRLVIVADEVAVNKTPPSCRNLEEVYLEDITAARTGIGGHVAPSAVNEATVIDTSGFWRKFEAPNGIGGGPSAVNITPPLWRFFKDFTARNGIGGHVNEAIAIDTSGFWRKFEAPNGIGGGTPPLWRFFKDFTARNGIGGDAARFLYLDGFPSKHPEIIIKSAKLAADPFPDEPKLPDGSVPDPKFPDGSLPREGGVLISTTKTELLIKSQWFSVRWSTVKTSETRSKPGTDV